MPAANHVLTTGLTFYRDRSSDARTTTTTTSLIGQVALGPRGPAAEVFPSPLQLGPRIDKFIFPYCEVAGAPVVPQLGFRFVDL